MRAPDDAAAGPPAVNDADADDFRLRIVRTATESLREAAREDSRLKVGKRRRRDTIKQTFTRRATLFGRSPSKSSRHIARPATADSVSRPDEDVVAPTDASPSTRLGNEEQQAKAEGFVGGSGRAAESRRRRNVYLNCPLPSAEVDKHGRPLARWPRNKVRTSKYSLLSFVPKNLSEQFRRTANIYFLLLVVLQVFPMFGAAAPQIAALPLLAVLVLTGLKDGIEDWRRHRLDNAVNGAPVTRLGRWRNVNLPQHNVSLWARILSFGRAAADPRVHASKGVRKLREKEGTFSTDFLSSTAALTKPEPSDTTSIAPTDEMESLSYIDTTDGDALGPLGNRPRANTTSSSVKASSFRSQANHGVVDYARAAASTGVWERTLWKKLEIGDVVLLKEDEQVPADIVVLSSSDPDGVCFVETKNLDGESNLKPRRSLKASMGIRSEEDVEHARFFIDSEPPHSNLYSYSGVLRFPTADGGRSKAEDGGTDGWAQEAITINEVLLRGCALRNTAWVIGIVLFSGSDTKIMLNSGETPSKRSRIERESNYNVLANFVILVALCLACAIPNGLWLASSNTSSDAYEPGFEISASAVVDAIITFASALILFQNIVPISLVITVELVKTLQALWIHLDVEMYYEELDMPLMPKTWNISDDLGQIAYVFSDKTGTLTSNRMELMRCSVGGVAYGEALTESMIGAAVRRGPDASESVFDPTQNDASIRVAKQTMLESMQRLFKNRWAQPDKLTLVSPELVSDLADRASEQRSRLIHFFRALALCHTVLADRSADEASRIEYKAESPDEAALVAGARDVGFVFLGRSVQALQVEIMGQPEQWTPLRVLEFNSTRKRASVIARAPDGRIQLITKGADSVIYERLRADHDDASKAALTRDLEDFASSGLRTLVIASRALGEEEFKDWARTYDAACSAVVDREEEIEKACEEIECDLEVLGATALEDKLQKGVPEAIEQLHRAGIALWVLTGDKLQTAIEISFSASILKPSMDVFIISAASPEGTRAQIEAGLDKINTARAKGDVRQEHAVVVDGDTLRHALDPGLAPLFLELTILCKTVVCCRVSPAQKAQVVLLVKDGRDAMTLAIGDGANDVAMIQAAHVGVGIAGLEGAQAAMSADYAAAQFRFLTRLLLVHGRWSYARTARMTLNFFFKSVIYTIALFLIQPWASFDSTYLFEVSLVLAYNLIFTSLAVMALGAFDQDVGAAASLAYPALYKRGIEGREYTRGLFWLSIADGCYQAIVVYFIPFAVFYSSTSISHHGHDFSLNELGTSVACCAILAANLYVGFNTSNWTWIVFVAVLGPCAILVGWMVVFNFLPGTRLTNILTTLFSSGEFWLIAILTQVVAIAPRFLWRYIQSNYRPTDVDIVRERSIVLGEAAGPDAEHGMANSPDTSPPPASSPALPTSGSEVMVAHHADLDIALSQKRPSLDLTRTNSDLELASLDHASIVMHTAPTSPRAPSA